MTAANRWTTTLATGEDVAAALREGDLRAAVFAMG